MNRQEILQRERDGARLAGFTAIAIAPLFFVATALDPQLGVIPIDGLSTERFTAIDSHASQLIAASLVRALALGLMVIPLLYLFRAAEARSERVNRAMIGFLFLGPLLFAVQGVLIAIAQTQVASDFVAQAARSGDVYTLLDDLLDDSTLYTVAVNLVLPGILALVVSMVYVPLQAQRVGLLTRFFATLGMALGVGILIIGPALLALVVWFAYLGFLILDRVPSGKPPAWEAGEAIPWPRPGEEPVAASEPAVVEGDATEVFAEPEEPADRSARRDRARKRKRKQRRR
jgi:hypothetical protein